MADVVGQVPARGEGAAQTPIAVPGRSTIDPMATVRLFAAARDAAGVGRDDLPGATVDEVLSAARERYGAAFEAVLGTCKIWVNGEQAAGTDPGRRHRRARGAAARVRRMHVTTLDPPVAVARRTPVVAQRTPGRG